MAVGEAAAITRFSAACPDGIGTASTPRSGVKTKAQRPDERPTRRQEHGKRWRRAWQPSLPERRHRAFRVGAGPIEDPLENVEGRWTLQILLRLGAGEHRFSDPRAAIPRISTNILTDRLRALESGELVEQHHLQPPHASQVYLLARSGHRPEAGTGRPCALACGNAQCVPSKRWSIRRPEHGAITMKLKETARGV
ncbi:winged helix-turn-helix transcriptional regulator [Sphingomonas sp. UNC305MFCol5.2]|uniref:winged helix-turn-helix transcriptional regulator n=1 Tax=Sphingomonas sp. UNC305MFCol5.2 TaxID=1449076 RepID=UPI001E2C9799|nr:helix-turn-helix domain-containing protein [Sphingomonas sp. UNC305MFCol5.2]